MPDLATTIADDWQYFDGVEEVEVTVGGTTKESVKALRGNPRTSDLAAIGGVRSETTVFSLWVSTLDGLVILPQGEIEQEDGTIWTIFDCELRVLDTKYWCLCRKKIVEV